MRSNCKIFEVAPYKTDWEHAAWRHDNSITRELVMSVLRLALSDWKKIGAEAYYKERGNYIFYYRDELCAFFNSSWFNDIITVMFPAFTQEAACKEISKQEYDVDELLDPNNNPSGARKKKKKS